MDVGRELSRINNIKTLLGVLLRDVKDYCKEADRDDHGTVLCVESAIESLDGAVGGLEDIQKDM